MKPAKHEPRRAVPDLSDDLDQRDVSDGEPLEDALVSGADLAGRTLSIIARRSTFQSASCAKSVIRSLKLRDVRLIRCDLSNAVLRGLEATRVEFIDCRLTGVKAVECRLEDVLFERCEASYPQFRDSTTRRAEFSDSRFADADFAGTDLQGSKWMQTVLTKAGLRNAKLRGADLRGAAIEGISINAADVDGAIVSPHQAMDLARLLGLVIR